MGIELLLLKVGACLLNRSFILACCWLLVASRYFLRTELAY